MLRPRAGELKSFSPLFTHAKNLNILILILPSSLSTKKPKNTSMTSRHLYPSIPGTIEVNDETAANAAKKSVKFGTNSAAEFDKLQPITKLTLMPTHTVQKIFPSDGKEETAEEQEVLRETKQNVAMLAEWDDLFGDESEQTPKCTRGMKCTPYKSKNTKRPSNSRRDSTLFSKEGIDNKDSTAPDAADPDEDSSADGKKPKAMPAGKKTKSALAALPAKNVESGWTPVMFRESFEKISTAGVFACNENCIAIVGNPEGEADVRMPITSESKSSFRCFVSVVI